MNLTDEEIKIKVAEAMGARLWNNPTQSGPSQLWGFQAPSPGEVFARMWLCGETDCLLPNYPEDLNACADFEATLTDEEWETYADHLLWNDGETGHSNYSACKTGCVAKPIRRCLAFLKTKGLI